MIATATPSRVRKTCRSCLIESRGRIRSLALTFLISSTWQPDVPPAAITVGDEADARVAAPRRCWFVLRAVAGADLVHGIEHRNSCRRLESAGADRRFRSDSVVPLLEECQAIRNVLLCEECRRSDLRRLLFHSQTARFDGSDILDDSQAGRMLLAEEAGKDGRRLEICEASARRCSRVEIVWLRAHRFPNAARQHRASDTDEAVLAECCRCAQRISARARSLPLRPAVSTARTPSEVSVHRLTL